MYRYAGFFSMATDPVCFAVVDEETTPFKATHNDREY